MTALCGIAAQRLISSPVLVGTLFAPTQGSHFQALQPLSFPFTCTLHWCKHCTLLEVTMNVCNFPMTAFCGIAAQRLIYRPVLNGTLSATTRRLYFKALHPHRFLFICTLHWCKHCTVLEVTTNVRKFPMTALCGISADGVVCGPVLVGTIFAPSQVYIFRLSIPFASFSHATCIGASIVPC